MQAAASSDAAAHFEQALAVVGSDDPVRRAELLERLALARRGVGDWEAALATLEEALQAYEELGRPEDVYAGRADEVAALRRHHQTGLPRPDAVSSIGAWNTLLGFTEALYVAGLRDEAGAGYHLIAGALERVGDWVTFDGRLASTRAGIAATAAGRYVDAERHLRTALATAEATSHQLEQVDVLRFLARLHLQRRAAGDDDRAHALLQQAGEGYRPAGLPEPPQPAFLRQARPA